MIEKPIHKVEIAVWYEENKIDVAMDLANKIEDLRAVTWDGSEGGLGSYDLVDGELIEGSPQQYAQTVKEIVESNGFTLEVMTEHTEWAGEPGTVMLWITEERYLSGEELFAS